MKCPECFGPIDEYCDDPVKLLGQPIGMFRCSNCGVMQVAGVPHLPCSMCNGTGFINIPDYGGETHEHKE